MNTEAIMLHVQENGIAYFGAAVVLIPLFVVFRKYTLPFVCHAAEYVVYCTIAHLLIGGLTRVFSWFRAETSFKNYNGELTPSFVPFTTPLNQDFWNRAMYVPSWLFWFEVGVAVLLLYVVVALRPLKFKQTTYKSKRPEPGKLSQRGPARYGAGPKKLRTNR